MEGVHRGAGTTEVQGRSSNWCHHCLPSISPSEMVDGLQGKDTTGFWISLCCWSSPNWKGSTLGTNALSHKDAVSLPQWMLTDSLPQKRYLNTANQMVQLRNDEMNPEMQKYAYIQRCKRKYLGSSKSQLHKELRLLYVQIKLHKSQQVQCVYRAVSLVAEWVKMCQKCSKA